MPLVSMLGIRLQPLLLILTVLLWIASGQNAAVTPVIMVLMLVLLAFCERLLPAHTDWKQTPIEKRTLVAIGVAAFVTYGVVLSLYQATITPSLIQLRQSFGFEIWPAHWPLPLQILLACLASELITYWIHRSVHRFGFLWRLSGHGFHHSFKNIHAINFLASHPLESFFLVLPLFLLGALFGANAGALQAASLLLLINAAIVHANIRTNSRGIGLVLTTSSYHRRHHSAVFAESNTNYSCNVILWDRLFGTHSEGPVHQTGIGPDEPGLLGKLLLPIREPASIATAPRNRPVSRV